jgi:cbb3-type cytochrome oxidase maturation protein
MDANMFEQLPSFLQFSKNTLKVIHASFVISLIYNIVGLSLSSARYLIATFCGHIDAIKLSNCYCIYNHSNNINGKKRRTEMSIMFILIGTSLLLAIGFLTAFIWSVKSGQLDDDYTPSVRILFDDFEKKKEEEKDIISPVEIK